MDSGALVTDEIIIDLVKARIQKDDCASGFLFDGFPRTIPQAQALEDQGIEIDRVIEITVLDEEILSRLSGRRVHEPSGRVYHITYNPPKREGFDDLTGEHLIQRDDDQEETIKERLIVYREQTAPLVDFYRQKSEGSDLEYHAVDGMGDTENTRDLILGILKD